MNESKPSNPKDIAGIRKVGMSVLPWRVLWRVAVAMFEGTVKYGRHNYRGVGVRASVYFDALQRHIGAWWEGEDIDRESQLNHVDKAIATLVVLRDSMLGGNWVDDRPIGEPEDLSPLHKMVSDLIDKHVDKTPHHYSRATPHPIPEVVKVPDPAEVKIYTYHPSNKISIIKALRTISGLSLKEAKDLSEMSFPITVYPAFGMTEADAKHILREAGARLTGENL
jgi:hypothetical protein